MEMKYRLACLIAELAAAAIQARADGDDDLHVKAIVRMNALKARHYQLVYGG